ncbi:MAG: hypothetical protein EPN37_14780 [Chitinophagaceae bacterium]|jgi:murein L,D-transpeptidase YafK|nr:MAG: hypothetical protein EPN37_14780 [Chitinophagaceae bacterium]
MIKKVLLTSVLCGLFCTVGFAQSFLQQQIQYPVFQAAYRQKDSILRKEFEAKGLAYPPRFIYIRSFKYDSRLEVWVKNNPIDTFTLFKSYRICALSGALGPKRQEGDYQVPEGFYYINQFEPRSVYHLALGLNYPNFSDRSQGDKAHPGSGIYIHGSCVTVGCIPLTDSKMDEVYILAVHARNLGQDYIPVHIFPVDFNNKHSVSFMDKSNADDKANRQFWGRLKEAFDDFNTTHRLPLILFDQSGDYVIKENNGSEELGKHIASGLSLQMLEEHKDPTLQSQ